MTILKDVRKFVGPANDSCFALCRGFDLVFECVRSPNCYGEVDSQFGQPMHEFRRTASRRVYHVQDAPLRIARRQHTVRAYRIGKFWTYRKTKHLDLL